MHDAGELARRRALRWRQGQGPMQQLNRPKWHAQICRKPCAANECLAAALSIGTRGPRDACRRVEHTRTRAAQFSTTGTARVAVGAPSVTDQLMRLAEGAALAGG